MYNAVPKTVWATDASGEALAIDTNAYTSGDVVGGLLRWDVGKLMDAAAGLITGATILDGDDVKGEFDLILFNAAPATPIDDADALATGWDQDHQNKMIGELLNIPASEYTSRNSLARAFKGWQATDQPVYGDARDGNNAGYIYGYLVAKGAHNFTNATALQVGLDVWRY